jgi:ribonuclease D
VHYDFIATARELEQFCASLSEAAVIAFDTEFVSEDSYRPHLCLVQVAADGRLAVIDALSVGEMTPFWQRLAAPSHVTVVHAGREDLCFCLRDIGQRPHGLFDTQIAAGMVGLEYPAAYSTLISKLLGETLSKGETRTDWRRRPLSDRQIEYALSDVIYLERIRTRLLQQLEPLGRVDWLKTELDSWQSQLEAAEFQDRWRRLSGVSGLSPRALAVARELWTWREEEAKQRNRPPRRVLRDDLIVELAKRGTPDIARIRAVRGMDHRDKQRYHRAIAARIQGALESPKNQWPRRLSRPGNRPALNLLGQFLATALSCICRSQQISPSIVGTVQDVRDLIAYRLGLDGAGQGELPALARGWRAEVVGKTIDELLAGKLSISIEEPLADQPLRFEPR